MQIAVFLLIAITIAAVARTLVPQMPLGLTANTVAYNRWLELTHAKYGGRADLFHVLGLFDIFNTWWFRSLVGALLVNALACTLIRVRRLWHAARGRIEPCLARRGAACCALSPSHKHKRALHATPLQSFDR